MLALLDCIYRPTSSATTSYLKHGGRLTRVFLLFSLFAAGCHRKTTISDEELLVHFAKHRADLELIAGALLKYPEISRLPPHPGDVKAAKVSQVSPGLVKDLEVKVQALRFSSVEVYPNGPSFFFAFSQRGGFYGGDEKGIAYLASPPDQIVARLNELNDLPRNMTHYRRIDGRWYLYIHSD